MDVECNEVASLLNCCTKYQKKIIESNQYIPCYYDQEPVNFEIFREHLDQNTPENTQESKRELPKKICKENQNIR